METTSSQLRISCLLHTFLIQTDALQWFSQKTQSSKEVFWVQNLTIRCKQRDPGRRPGIYAQCPISSYQKVWRDILSDLKWQQKQEGYRSEWSNMQPCRWNHQKCHSPSKQDTMLCCCCWWWRVSCPTCLCFRCQLRLIIRTVMSFCCRAVLPTSFRNWGAHFVGRVTLSWRSSSSLQAWAMTPGKLTEIILQRGLTRWCLQDWLLMWFCQQQAHHQTITGGCHQPLHVSSQSRCPLLVSSDFQLLSPFQHNAFDFLSVTMSHFTTTRGGAGRGHYHVITCTNGGIYWPSSYSEMQVPPPDCIKPPCPWRPQYQQQSR